MELSFAGPSLESTRREALRRRLRPAILVLVSWSLLALAIWSATQEPSYENDEFPHSTPYDSYNLTFATVMLQIVAASAGVVLMHARTDCLFHLGTILLVMWISEAALVVQYILQFLRIKDYGLTVAISLGCLHGVGFGHQKTFIFNCMSDIELVLAIDLGTRKAARMLLVDAVLSILAVTAAAAQRLRADMGLHWPNSVRILSSMVCWAFLITSTVFASQSFDVMGRVLRLAENTTAHLAQEAKSRSQLWFQNGDPEIQATFHKLRKHRRHVLTLSVSRLLVFGHIMLFGGFLWPLPADLSAQVTDGLGGGFAGYLMTDSVFITTLYYLYLIVIIWYVYGGLSSLVGIHARFQEEELRLAKRAHQQARFSSSSDPRWQAQVQDLACRAITVEVLLDFYHGLGRDYMRGFNPDRHTTSDVVRQAIIPLSASAGSDMASILMQGQRMLPEAMVSHTWRGRFRDLVAAVVADGLGEQEYGRIGNLLDTDVDLIKHWISRGCGLQRTYWICAFCVNQHKSICSPMVPQTDSVTGALVPPCGCGYPKFLNTDAPCREDGASIPCEMNKFGDMMAWLAAKDSSFTHVLALDLDLDLLQRAWCVAEAAESYIMGMSQYMKVSSLSNIRRKWAKVKKLRVEDMSASRPEDVAEILQRIPNKEEFNTQIQKLFDRLFGQFWHLPPSERVRVMCRELRWRMNMVEAMSEEAASPMSSGSQNKGAKSPLPPLESEAF